MMLGVAIELLGTLLSVLGLNLMKYTAMRSAPEDAAQPSIVSGPKLLALLVYMGGQLTETIALAFGNSAVLSACSASALVWNAMLANRLFKEQFTLVDATATSAICMGIIACAVTGPPSHDLTVESFEHKARELPFVVFCCVLLAVIVACLIMLHAPWFQPADDQAQNGGNGAVLYSLLTASVGSFCYFLGSVNSQLIKQNIKDSNNPGAVQIILLAVFLGFCTSNLIFINTALAKYEALIFVPIYYVLNILFTVFGCLVFYDDFHALSPPIWNAVVFGGGVVAILIGVRVLSLRDAGTNTSEFPTEDIADNAELLSPCGLHVSRDRRGDELSAGLTTEDLECGAPSRRHRHTATLCARTGFIGSIVLPPTTQRVDHARNHTAPDSTDSGRSFTAPF